MYNVIPTENKLLTEQTLFPFELSSEYWFKVPTKTYTGESKNSNVFFLAPVGKSRWKIQL